MTSYTIERLGYQGDGVFTDGGRDVFAPFTLPGEVVSGSIQGDRLIDLRVETPSDTRIKPMCRHFKTCGGCVTQHAQDDYLADWKQTAVRETLSRHGLTPHFRPIITSPPRSRRRAAFSGRRTKKAAMVGFHGARSDALIEVSDCALVQPEILIGLDGFKTLVRAAASRSSEVKIAVTTSSGGLDVDVRDGKEMTTELMSEVVKIAQTENYARLSWDGDVILERQPPLQTFGSAQVRPPAGSFLQATPEGEQALVNAVLEISAGAKKAVDLFAGCGTLSLPLAEIAEVHAVEGDADMTTALDTGWRHSDGLKTVTTEARDLFRRPLLSDEFKGVDVVVLDPPRAGAKAQIEVLCDAGVPTIAYVSCNPSTFARDAERLVAAGYEFQWVQVVDQFRWSAHSELVGAFQKA